MNKRLQKLMRQANIKWFYDNSVMFIGDQDHLGLHLEKFAELIIEECAKIADDCYTYHEPLSKVPTHIKKFERLTDENMSHKL